MNWFDIVIGIIIVYSIFRGYRSGLVRQLASLVGIVAGIILSNKVSFVILPYFRSWGIFPESLVEPAAFIASFLIIVAVVLILGHMLQTILETIKVGSLNRIGGVVFSAAKWLVVVSLILNLVEAMDKDHILIPADINQKSKTYQYVKPIVPAITPYLRFDLDLDKDI